MEVNELEERLHKLELDTAYRNGSVDRHIERFQRAIIRTSTTKDLHNSEISAIKPVLERLDQTNNVFGKFEVKVASIEHGITKFKQTVDKKVTDLKQTIDKIGKVDVLKIVSTGVGTFIAGVISAVIFSGVLHSRGTNAQFVRSEPVSQSQLRSFRTPTYKDARIN